MRVAILASGSGTTAEAFAQAVDSGRVDAEIGLIVHNNPDAGVVNQSTIKKLGVATRCINGKTQPEPAGARRGELGDMESQAIADAIHESGSELVLLLGFMKRVRGALLAEFGYDPTQHTEVVQARMLNTHPGPLPQTRGLHGFSVHQKVFELYANGELNTTGPTLHAVAAEYDMGPTVRYFDQVELSQADTPQTIEDRVREVEREMLPIGVHEFIQSL